MPARRELLLEGNTAGVAMVALGPFFIDELREDGESLDSPPGLKRDWFTVAEWLGHSGGEFSPEHRKLIADAWTAYFAIGVAPCLRLQSNFDSISAEMKRESKLRPPSQILDVFDRLLASDAEIREKRESDLRDERIKIQRAFQGKSASAKGGWWRRKRPEQRQWIFLCSIWAIGVFAYAWLFDPFDTGGWGDMEDEHFYRLYAIALFPAIAGIVAVIYRRWVR